MLKKNQEHSHVARAKRGQNVYFGLKCLGEKKYHLEEENRYRSGFLFSMGVVVVLVLT